MNHYDVIVVGGGASGLFCASTAGKRGLNVLVLEGSNKVGKKILMSGGGRCNFTNLYVSADNYISKNPHFSKSALNGFSQWQFLELVQQHQIPYHERKHGELFCDDSAKDILNMLMAECDKSGVMIKTKCQINKVASKAGGVFSLETTLGIYSGSSLVVATGGLSIPTMGATGFGYQLAEQFGHKLLPRSAGLVPFTFSDSIKDVSERLSGLALDVELTTDKTSFRENVLFTHRGLSGPVVLQLSNYWQPGKVIYMNLLPDVNAYDLLLTAKKEQAKNLLRNVLFRYLSKGLVAELQTLFWPDYSQTSMAEIPDSFLKQVAEHLNCWQLKPSGTEGYRTAEVTLGGVDTDLLSSKTMESKLKPGLFFIGEVVDVTGHLGGFNFQWAWASAYAAGQFVG